MIRIKFLLSVLVLPAAFLPFSPCIPGVMSAYAHEDKTVRALDHAPLGVMGDHMHRKGEWMVSYRYQHMSMSGHLDGTGSLSDQDILSYPNRYPGHKGMMMGPKTLRLVPQDMTMGMHMLGMMYAPSDFLTLMGMAMFTRKDMELETYKGMKGDSRLGRFKTDSSGLASLSFSVLFKLYQTKGMRMHGLLALMPPVGSVKKTGEVLTPMGKRMTMRLPYAMQVGDKAWAMKIGLTYVADKGKWNFGFQPLYKLGLDKNDQGWRYGNHLTVTAWLAREVERTTSLSVRLAYAYQDKIKGHDKNIMAPVQTANPDFYGGESLDLALGVNKLMSLQYKDSDRLALEVSFPLWQDLNGPQMKRRWSVMLGWQRSF